MKTIVKPDQRRDYFLDFWCFPSLTALWIFPHPHLSFFFFLTTPLSLSFDIIIFPPFFPLSSAPKPQLKPSYLPYYCPSVQTFLFVVEISLQQPSTRLSFPSFFPHHPQYLVVIQSFSNLKRLNDCCFLRCCLNFLRLIYLSV
jgi:hypothetical protein